MIDYGIHRAEGRKAKLPEKNCLGPWNAKKSCRLDRKIKK